MELGEFQRTVVLATDRLAEEMGGDEGAFYAILFALGNGYDVYQILTGCLNDRLDVNGGITAADESVLTPAREPEGAFDLGAAGGGTDRAVPAYSRALASRTTPALVAETPYQAARRIRMQFWGGAVLLGEFFGEVRDRYEELKAEDLLYAEFYDRIAFLATTLAARGYSVQQILEGILLDRVRVFADPEGDGSFCFYIEHTSGVVLRPVHPPADPLAELTCPAAEESAPEGFEREVVQAGLSDWGLGEYADTGSGPAEGGTDAAAPAEIGDAPWVFEGTGLLRSTTITEGAQVCQDTACPYVLTLHPDGGAELVVARGFGWEEGQCVERDGNRYVGTWQDGTFSILGRFQAGGPIVDPSFSVTGTFTQDAATGRGGYDNEAGFSAVFDFESPGLMRKAD